MSPQVVVNKLNVIKRKKKEGRNYHNTHPHECYKQNKVKIKTLGVNGRHSKVCI